jgi:hypothetical protein
MSQGGVMMAEPADRVPAGEARINFAEHQVRANAQGAQDFEEMIGQLVHAVRFGVARTVAANSGDWVIDVVMAISVVPHRAFMQHATIAFMRGLRTPVGTVMIPAATQISWIGTGCFVATVLDEESDVRNVLRCDSIDVAAPQLCWARLNSVAIVGPTLDSDSPVRNGTRFRCT